MGLSASFLNLSEHVGSDILLVQGAGGNSSVKISDNKMFIKASGTWLSDSNKKDIFVSVNRKLITNDLMKNKLKSMEEYLIEGSLKPSIETLMHAIIPYKFTFHLHCLRSLAMTSSSEFQSSILSEFLEDFCIIDYAAPGLDLARLINHEIINSDIAPKIFFLKNHGIIISADDLSEIRQITSLLTNKLDPDYLNSENLKSKSLEVITKDGMYKNFVLLESKAFDSYKLNERVLNSLTSGILYPDHAVFLGDRINFFHTPPDESQLIDFEYFIILGEGVFIKKDISKIKIFMILSLIHIGLFLNDKSYNYLSSNDISSLLSRDDETHRIALN